MKIWLPPVAGTMAVLLLALVVILVRQNRAIAELHDRATDERAGWQAERETAHLRVLDRERELREAHDTIAQLRRELAVSRAAAGFELDRDRGLSDPAVEEFRQRQHRRIVQERYGDLFERLNLSAESLEEFKRLLIELEAPAWRGPAPVNSAATDALTVVDASPLRRPTAEIHEAIYHLLGYEDYQAFDRYGRELTNVRPHVRRFASDAADAGHPLTAVQRTALARVIFDVTDPQTHAEAVAPGANKPHPSTGLTPLDDQVLAKATEVLSRPQLELLKAFRIQEREGLAAWRQSLTPDEASDAAPAPAPTDPGNE